MALLSLCAGITGMCHHTLYQPIVLSVSPPERGGEVSGSWVLAENLACIRMTGTGGLFTLPTKTQFPPFVAQPRAVYNFLVSFLVAPLPIGIVFLRMLCYKRRSLLQIQKGESWNYEFKLLAGKIYPVISVMWTLVFLCQMLSQVHSHVVPVWFLETIGRTYIPFYPCGNCSSLFQGDLVAKWQEWNSYPGLSVSSLCPALTIPVIASSESSLSFNPVDQEPPVEMWIYGLILWPCEDLSSFWTQFPHL
jgi:hypothetical protein